MDEIVTQLLNYKTAILMVAVVVGTSLIRRLVETAFPQLRKAADEMAAAPTYTSVAASWWNQVGLDYLPVMLGAILAICVKDLVTITGLSSLTAVAIYGGIAGWFSSTGYKVLGKVFKAKTGIDLPSDSIRPQNLVLAQKVVETTTILAKQDADTSKREDVKAAVPVTDVSAPPVTTDIVK